MTLTNIDDWSDWKWQQRNAVSKLDELLNYFPGLEQGDWLSRISKHLQNRKLSVTPYALSLIRADEHMRPLAEDPLWRRSIDAQRLQAHLLDHRIAVNRPQHPAFSSLIRITLCKAALSDKVLGLLDEVQEASA